jgi:hypothetical protein
VNDTESRGLAQVRLALQKVVLLALQIARGEESDGCAGCR